MPDTVVFGYNTHGEIHDHVADERDGEYNAKGCSGHGWKEGADEAKHDGKACCQTCANQYETSDGDRIIQWRAQKNTAQKQDDK